ncbi:alpha/beta fold hydrolase [Guggenheimella bovis]
MDYLNYLGSIMGSNPEINEGGDILGDILSEEYGMLDKVNYIRGLMENFGCFYLQLYPIDLRECYDKLEVPVYFLLGRHDINAPLSLAQDYFDRLEAPRKEIRWFEHSGHNPWLTESDLFVQTVLELTGVS